MGVLIGFVGPPQSGKDTACDYLVEEHGFHKFSFADAIRESLLEIDPWADSFLRVSEVVKRWGWNHAKLHFPEIRRLLQTLGYEAGRKIHGDDIWVDKTMAQVDQLKGENICIADVRFKNELFAINRRGGLICRVRRSVPMSNEVLSHLSEIESGSLVPDLSVYNHTDITDYQRRLERTLTDVRQRLGVA